MKSLRHLIKRFIYFFSRFQIPAKEIGTYQSRLLAEVVSKKTEIFIGNDAEKIFPNLNYLALTTAYLSLSEIRTVNDFGGAAGIHFF